VRNVRSPAAAHDDPDWAHLTGEVRDLLLGMDWAEAASVRMREAGHIFVGGALVLPKPGTEDLLSKLHQAAEEAKPSTGGCMNSWSAGRAAAGAREEP